ncbi:transcriptional regulator [Mycobacterium sp. 852002-51971_SCH5477799-a]|uniref:TetR/AcrR family transcriptional regulator n=1 Tax=Mycobacterium sp. 852002-51971_SCH5477799-a TaxID=1834106 RepID=UPI000800CD81|nr:TetR/AcrR family transcriptional regulator [Mycobacterium sp. 852002-51971_SCH5477799-a]OBF63521.1 transcriptional regulator [Mycobacterium sp. 852002-51971_SCH5477799-a]
MVVTSRQRIIAEALRLFGERGFAATTIAQIEEAAGLSPGSGALYRHFPSKDQLLYEAVGETLADRDQWAPYYEPDFSVVAMLEDAAPDADLIERLVLLCQVGLGRLDHNRDVTRILMRDSSASAEVMEVFRRNEYLQVLSVISRGLAELAGPDHPGDDWDAAAVVVLSAVAHYWLIRDTFGGQHPAAIDEQRYLRSTAEMLAARLQWHRPPPNTSERKHDG